MSLHNNVFNIYFSLLVFHDDRIAEYFDRIVFILDFLAQGFGDGDLGMAVAKSKDICLLALVQLGIKISFFIEKHPTLKMLALAFLLMIGVVLVADGLGQHIPKGYVYFSMAFSLGVEVLNIVATSRRKAKKLAAPTAGAAKP